MHTSGYGPARRQVRARRGGADGEAGTAGTRSGLTHGRPHGETLPAEFYLRPTLRVARELLGKLLVYDVSPETARGISKRRARETRSGNEQASIRVTSISRLVGRIVEVEAYRGVCDRAAHSYGGHRSRRNETMYGPAGRAYVYLIYGVHHCLNVVCRPEGVPEAVLIRAVEPLEGMEMMARHRRLFRGGQFVLSARDRIRLCRGPGCVCRAFGIDRRLDGADLIRGPLRVLDAETIAPAHVGRSPRIGVAYAGADAARPWRFFIAGNPCVSRQPFSRSPAFEGR